MAAHIVVEAPDVISTADLVERLAPFGPQSLPTPGDGYDVTLTREPPPEKLKELLAAIGEWAEFWSLRETLIRVGRASYRLHNGPRPLDWIDL